MKDQKQGNTVYSGNKKGIVENHETEISSRNDNRWSEGRVSKEPLRKVVVWSEIRVELKDTEPSNRRHERRKI